MSSTFSSSLLDTTPRWLSLTLVFSAVTIIMSGVGILLSAGATTAEFAITPVTLILHLVWALCISSWILNLRIKVSKEVKPVLAVGIVVAIGSAWSSLQQWIAYQQSGAVNDLTLIIGAMLMDVIGGIVTYVLYSVNALRNVKVVIS